MRKRFDPIELKDEEKYQYSEAWKEIREEDGAEKFLWAIFLISGILSLIMPFFRIIFLFLGLLYVMHTIERRQLAHSRLLHRSLIFEIEKLKKRSKR